MVEEITTEVKLCCQDKSQSGNLLGVDGSALHSVNAGGVDAGMAQNVRQPGQVFFQRVIRPSKQVPEVVWKDFPRLHVCALTQLFHIPPDVGAIQWLARPGGEHRPGGLFLFPEIFFQQPLQLVRKEHHPAFALIENLRPANAHGLGGDEA